MPLSPWRRFLNTSQIQNDYSERPAGLGWRSNAFFVLATVAVGLFTDLFLYSLVVPVIPFLLQDRIGVPSEQVQSYTSALLATLAGASVVSSPVAGVIADRVSTRQAPFLLGLSALIGATVLLFTGTTVPILVIARILQGVSSAVVWTVGLAMCIETVGPENLGKAIGTIFSIVSAGAIWAPFLGGILYEKTGVGGVLAIALAVLGVDFIMRLLVIEKKVAARYAPEYSSEPDGANETGGDGDDNNTQAENGEQQPLLENRQTEDLSDYKLPEQTSRVTRTVKVLPCLKNYSLLTALVLALMQAIVLGSLDSTVAIVSNELFGFSSLKAGIMFLPIGVLDLLCGPIFGWAVDRYGTKVVAVFSFAWLVPVHVLLRLPQPGGLDQILLYGGLLALTGVGLSGIGAPSIVEAGAVVDKYYKANPEFFGDNGPYAQLYSLNSMLFNVGLTAGPELAGELKSLIGYGNMNIVIAVLCALTAVLSFFYLGGKPKVMGKSKL